MKQFFETRLNTEIKIGVSSIGM